jgi:hypothetical protein
MIKHPRCRRTSRQIVLFLSFCNKTMSSKVLDFQQQQQLLVIPLATNDLRTSGDQSVFGHLSHSKQLLQQALLASLLVCLLYRLLHIYFNNTVLLILLLL